MSFELILTLAVLITGTIVLIDKFFLAPLRKRQPILVVGSDGTMSTDATDTPKLPKIIEYARSFFPVLFIVLLFRSFCFEPFRIPSSSLEPTLLIGDFILVNKFAYGLRLPVLNTKIMNLGEPKVGDIAVFRYPVNPKENFIKRIIGVPGDHIRYIDKVLYINGQPAPQQLLISTTAADHQGVVWPVVEKRENLLGVQHAIYQRPSAPAQNFDIVVPAGHFFAMGDNRDDSSDSRYWGFVPEENLAGRAIAVWLSWDNKQKNFRWSRMGQSIH